MIFRIATPGGGTVTAEIKPASRCYARNSHDGLRRYDWNCNAFLGQHGDPFGTVAAGNIEEAHDMARELIRSRLTRKYAYEEFCERRNLA